MRQQGYTLLILAIFIVTGFVAYKVGHQAGYDNGKTVGSIMGQAKGSLDTTKRAADDTEAKNADINKHIVAAYAQGCTYALNDALTAFGYDPTKMSGQVDQKCSGGEKVLPYYNL